MFRATKLAVLAAVAALLAALALTGTAVAKETLHASLSGKKEPAGGDRNGRGSARITLFAARGRVCYDITLRRVGTVAQGHIHAGRSGQDGNVVVPLFDRPTKRPRGCVNGVAKSTIRSIGRHPGRFYVNVHNTRHPAGAARGQLHR